MPDETPPETEDFSQKVFVNESVIPTQIQSQVKLLLAAAAGFLLDKGVIKDPNTLYAIVGVALFVWPAVWSWLKNMKRHTEMMTMAAKLPDKDAEIITK